MTALVGGSLRELIVSVTQGPERGAHRGLNVGVGGTRSQQSNGQRHTGFDRMAPGDGRQNHEKSIGRLG